MKKTLISNMFDVFFANPKNEINGLGGRFRAEDFLKLRRIMNGNSGNFVIFDNAGGNRFTIWELDSPEDVQTFVDSPELGRLIYAYRIGNVDTIIRKLGF